MLTGLRRHQTSNHLHAINVNCFRKRPLFATPEPCDTFLSLLEQTRLRYSFHILAYVLMPTHIHLLVSEPESHPLSSAIQVLKQRFSRTRILEDHVWERRYYDFNVFTARKLQEKIDYIHMNPVTAGIALTPADWPWSSYRTHAFNEPGPVTITTRWPL